jgi:NAD(P)H dehydrogenase (quinone)
MMRMIASFIICGLIAASDAAAQQVLVVYYSQSGRTQAMAESVARGARVVANIDVHLQTIDSTSASDLAAADAIIVGSPVHGGNVAVPVMAFMNSWTWPSAMQDKIGAAFVTGGGISAGEELTQTAILHTMLIYGMIIVGGPTWEQAFGASAITDEAPFVNAGRKESVDQKFLDRAFGLGKRVAEVAKRMKTQRKD